MKKNVKILHVEDDMIDAILVKEMLSTACKTPTFDIIHKENVLESLKVFTEDKFDLILLDLTIGCDSSIDIIPLFRNIDPEVPIVMLTGNDNDRLAEKSIEKGAQDYVVKGYNDQNLLRFAIMSAIQRQKAQILASENHEFDPITGCMNKKAFRKAAQERFLWSRSFACHEIVSMVHLNNVKDIHFTYGEKVTSDILKQFAIRIKDIIKDGGLLAHGNYGNFYLLTEDQGEDASISAKEFFANLQDALKEPIYVERKQEFVTPLVSITYNIYPEHGASFDEIMQNIQHTMSEMRRYGGKQMRLAKQYVS